VDDVRWWHFGLGRENGLAFWGMVFLEGSFAAYMPIWTLFMEELGAPITLIGLLLGFGGIIRFFILLPTASLAKRFGAKRLLIISRSISFIGIGTAAFAPSWPWLLPAMIGIAAGSMAFPIVLSHVAANAGKERVRAFALVVTIGPSVAFLIAPLISSGFIALFGLRSPFVVSALFSLISVLIFTRIKSDHNPVEEGREAVAGESYRTALAVPQVRSVLLLKFLTIFILGLGAQLLPNYLRQVGGHSDDLIALLASLSAVGSMGFGFLLVRNKRFASSPMRGAGIAVAGVSIGYLLFLQPEVLPVIVVGFILRGGLFSSIALFSAALGDVTPDRNHHHIFTISEILIVAGFTLAPIVAGLLYNIWPALPLVVAASLSVPLIGYLLQANLTSQADTEVAPVTS
jgi:MFS family permease